MIEFATANEILNLVINEDESFKKALKRTFKDGKQNSKLLADASAWAGCELRHHYLFLEIYKNLGFELNTKQQIDLYLFLSNKYFLRRFGLDETLKHLKESLGDELFGAIYPNFENLESLASLLEYPHDSIEYLSIRFNTPKWLIKMWGKHFGRGVCFKVLKKNVKPFVHTYRVNTLENKTAKPEDLSAEFEDFGIKDMVVSKEKNNPKNSKLVKEEYVFPLRAPIKEIVDKYQNEFIDEISLYSGDDNSIVKELLVRSNLKVGINLAVPEIEDRAEIIRQIRINKAKNINLFKAHDEISMRTGISKKQELFFIFPKSSSFDKIRSYPDYLLHFKHDSIDKLLKQEQEALEMCSKFIEKDGTMVYMVDTLNRKECDLMVKSFLESHQDFELIENKYFFPFEKEDTIFYFAAMRLKGNND